MYVPAGSFPTLNDAVSVPPEIIHVEEENVMPDSVQLVSVEENPDPNTRTWGLGKREDHTWAEPGFSMSGFRVTLKRRSPVLSVKMALSG
jgi:hypothetical protein